MVTIEKSAIRIGGVRYKDTGGGFLLEENLEEPETEVSAVKTLISNPNSDLQLTPMTEQPPIFEPDRPACETCNKTFAKSWLFDNFDHKVCDDCKYVVLTLRTANFTDSYSAETTTSTNSSRKLRRKRNTS